MTTNANDIMETLETLLSIAIDHGADFRPKYLGRCMMDSKCPGIVFNDDDSYESIIEEAMDAGIRGAKVDWPVVYWPNIRTNDVEMENYFHDSDG